MKIRICDRCKVNLDDIRILGRLFTVSYWKETKELSSVKEFLFGGKKEIDICASCFDEFNRFVDTKTNQK